MRHPAVPHALAVLSGLAWGIAGHAGWGGETAALFLADGEGNVDAGIAAIVLIAIAGLTTGVLWLPRRVPAGPTMAAAAFLGAGVTLMIVTTEADQLWRYVPGILLIGLVRWPTAMRVASGAVAAVFAVSWVQQTWYIHTGYYGGPGVDLLVVAVHGGPTLMALADAIGLRRAEPPTAV